MPSTPQSSGPRRTVVKSGPSPAKLLASVPRRPMTAEQQLAAVSKVHQQADHRIKLGQQLFKAAEARLSQHQDLLDQVRTEQSTLREQVQGDVAKSLQTYDQWMGRIDESFTKAITQLNSRMEQAEQEIAASRDTMQQMLAQVDAMVRQTQQLLEGALGEDAMPAPAHHAPGATPGATTPTPPPPAPVIVPEKHPAQNPSPDIFGQLLDQLRVGRDDDVAA